MAGDAHGDKTQEVAEAAQDERSQQAQEGQPQVSGVDWEKAIAERDGRIAKLEAQVADAARNAEAAEALRGEIAELKAQGESYRIDFQLQLAGVRNVKAARAVLADHGGLELCQHERSLNARAFSLKTCRGRVFLTLEAWTR